MSNLYEVSNDYKALYFLKGKFPDVPACLTAIPPDGGRTITETFFPHEEEEVLIFVSEHNGKDNLYFHSNPVRKRMNNKAKKEDIHCGIRLHVDVDPRHDYDFGQERERIKNMLLSLSSRLPLPSTVIFSGGGYQALWDLSEEDWVTFGSQDDIDEIELRNIYLAQHYGGDSCHDVSRLLRLPGTINIPNKKKRERGRTECMAEVVFSSNRVYRISDFPKSERVRVEKASGTAINPVISAKPITNNDLHKLPISSRAKKIIVLGTDPHKIQQYPSRSEAQWSASCEMARAGVPDPVHKSIPLDPRLGISQCILDKPNPEQYADKQIQGAHDAKRK